MNLGKKIQTARIKARIPQRKLARSVGVSRQSVSNYEVGKTIPRADVMKKLAKELNLGDW
ncbi:MAG: helix-turn-helix transcriptional regulator [Nitrospiria bacterium]